MDALQTKNMLTTILSTSYSPADVATLLTSQRDWLIANWDKYPVIQLAAIIQKRCG